MYECFANYVIFYTMFMQISPINIVSHSSVYFIIVANISLHINSSLRLGKVYLNVECCVF